jgi:transcriptional regulator with XRE-family HTH domain
MARRLRRETQLGRAMLDGMRERGWIQAELVTRSKLSAGTISNLINGVGNTDWRTARRAADLFGWSDKHLAELLHGRLDDTTRLRVDEIVAILEGCTAEQLEQARKMLEVLIGDRGGTTPRSPGRSNTGE